MKQISFTVTLTVPDSVELAPDNIKKLEDNVTANLRLWHGANLWEVPVNEFAVRAHKEYTEDELRVIGDHIAERYMLRRAEDGKDGFKLATGWKTNLGLARQFIAEGAALQEGYEF